MAIPTALTPAALAHENVRYAGTPGCSAGNRHAGFAPAFLDTVSGRVVPSRFADGRAAPVHMLDGLPPEFVLQRGDAGRVRSLRPGVVSGFVRGGRFYTREEALEAASAG